MKIRNNFITNSSSSSYIVAKKNNINKEKLREEFSKEYFKNKELYKYLLESVVQCFGYSEEDFIDEEDNYYDERDLMLAYLKKEDIDEKYIDFLTNRTLKLFSEPYDSTGTLDSWDVTTVRATNEDNDPFLWMLYYNAAIVESDFIKVI